MSDKIHLGGEITLEYLKLHPKMQKQTLAKLMYKEHPKLFKNVEDARDSVRYYTGAHGKLHREHLTVKDFVIPKGTPDNKYSMPKSEAEAWTPFTIPKECMKALILPDIHLPYQDNDACNIAIEYGKKAKCDTVILLGDLMDSYGVSSFQKDPRMRDMASEVETTRHFLMALRKTFPKAKIIYKGGNHEARIPRYGMRNAPELFGADFIKTLDDVLELDRLGVKWVDEKRPMYFGKLNVLHGSEYGGRNGGVNPSRNMYLKTKECCIAGHWHKSSQYNSKTVRDRVVTCWTLGCLCDMHPEYMPVNEWNLGFAVIERDDTDWFHVDSRRIIHNKVV